MADDGSTIRTQKWLPSTWHASTAFLSFLVLSPCLQSLTPDGSCESISDLVSITEHHWAKVNGMHNGFHGPNQTRPVEASEDHRAPRISTASALVQLSEMNTTASPRLWRLNFWCQFQLVLSKFPYLRATSSSTWAALSHWVQMEEPITWYGLGRSFFHCLRSKKSTSESSILDQTCGQFWELTFQASSVTLHIEVLVILVRCCF